jgi:hypothetical protein
VIGPQRRIARAAAVASVLGGAPSILHAWFSGDSPLVYTVGVTRAVGTLLPPGRPGFVRGAVVHVAISAGAGEVLAIALPRRHPVRWGAGLGLAMGLVNIVVLGPRYFPAVAELPRLWQIADNVAFGAVFAAVVSQRTRERV